MGQHSGFGIQEQPLIVGTRVARKSMAMRRPRIWAGMKTFRKRANDYSSGALNLTQCAAICSRDGGAFGTRGAQDPCLEVDVGYYWPAPHSRFWHISGCEVQGSC